MMGKFRKRPVVIEATQGFKDGDHEQVVPVIRAHAIPNCFLCGKHDLDHGWVETLEGGHRVCPGDWIITGIKGEFYPCKPDIFDMTYEKVEAVTNAH